MQILVTGGTGYIGSHTIVKLLNYRYDVGEGMACDGGCIASY